MRLIYLYRIGNLQELRSIVNICHVESGENLLWPPWLSPLWRPESFSSVTVDVSSSSNSTARTVIYIYKIITPTYKIKTSMLLSNQYRTIRRHLSRSVSPSRPRTSPNLCSRCSVPAMPSPSDYSRGFACPLAFSEISFLLCQLCSIFHTNRYIDINRVLLYNLRRCVFPRFRFESWVCCRCVRFCAPGWHTRYARGSHLAISF